MFDIRVLIIAVGAAFVSGVGASWWVTAEYKNAKFDQTISTIRLDAAEAVRLAMDKVRVVDADNVRIATELEVAHNEFKSNLDGVKADFARIVVERDGLYDRNSTSANSNVPSTSSSAPSASVSSTGSKLSKELTQLLLSESARADEAAAYARTCYDWVVKMRVQNVAK